MTCRTNMFPLSCRRNKLQPNRSSLAIFSEMYFFRRKTDHCVPPYALRMSVLNPQQQAALVPRRRHMRECTHTQTVTSCKWWTTGMKLHTNDWWVQFDCLYRNFITEILAPAKHMPAVGFWSPVMHDMTICLHSIHCRKWPSAATNCTGQLSGSSGR